MPYFAVQSGNVFRCVLADDPTSACVTAVTQHCKDEDAENCAPGIIFQVAEFGHSVGDNVYILSKFIRDAGDFNIVEAD
jgi:hypothetical protein